LRTAPYQLAVFWTNFWTRNARNSNKGSENAYSAQESKNTPSQNIGAWDRVMRSSNSIQCIHNCILPSNATMSGTHLKHLTFSMQGDGSLDHT